MHINEAYLVQIEGWRGAVRQLPPATGVQTARKKVPVTIHPAIGSVLIWFLALVFCAVFAILGCWSAVLPLPSEIAFDPFMPREYKPTPETQSPIPPVRIEKLYFRHTVNLDLPFENRDHLGFLSRSIIRHDHNLEAYRFRVGPNHLGNVVDSPAPLGKRIENSGWPDAGIDFAVADERFGVSVDRKPSANFKRSILVLDWPRTIHLYPQLRPVLFSYQVALFFHQSSLEQSSIGGFLSSSDGIPENLCLLSHLVRLSTDETSLTCRHIRLTPNVARLISQENESANADPNSGNTNHSQHNANPKSKYILPVFSGESDDLYICINVLLIFGLEGCSVVLLYRSRRSWLGWALAIASLLCLISMGVSIQRDQRDRIQDYRHTPKHNSINVSQKHLTYAMYL